MATRRRARHTIDGQDAYRTAELAEIYDVVYADVPDVTFWLSMAAAVPHGPILELACGTGRVLLPMARAGSEVVGLDLSPVMLERCKAHLRKEPAEVRDRVALVQGDMTSFDLGRKVGAVFCPFNSFHHLRSADAQLACLARCHAHLPSQGLLVLDLFNPDPAPRSKRRHPRAPPATGACGSLRLVRRRGASASGCQPAGTIGSSRPTNAR